METENGKLGLSGNALKIIAALSMLIDHIGVIFFPLEDGYRIVGRLAFPIFAFMIAEGCHYTKNKLKYFLSVFILGAACQTVYFIYDGSDLLGILISFSLSIPTAYALEFMKRVAFSEKCTTVYKVFAFLTFVFSVISVYILNEILNVDYGFFGCMAPVFVNLVRVPRGMDIPYLNAVDKLPVRILLFAVPLVLATTYMSDFQIYSLLALPFLLLYSGKRGKLKMKYFFYVFYPLHLALLEGINYLF